MSLFEINMSQLLQTISILKDIIAATTTGTVKRSIKSIVTKEILVI